jgi:hypothetical protein
MSECVRLSVVESLKCQERDMMTETRQLLDVTQRRLCELESGRQRLIESISEVNRICDLVLESIRTLSGAHSASLNVLNDSIRFVGADIERMKTDVSGYCDAGREHRLRVEELFGKFEKADDRLRASVDSMTSEVTAGHSAVDCLRERFDEMKRDANGGHDQIKKLIVETNGQVIECVNALKVRVWGIGATMIGFSPQYELNGVMAFLKRSHGGNVHDKGVVNVTASSIGWCEPKNVADIGVQSVFYTTNNTSSEWVHYDFKSMRIRPSHYTLRSPYGWGVNHWHPKNWVIEVSETGRESDWTEIDRQTNSTDLNGPDKRKSFAISRSIGPVEFIRLRLTGPNHGGSNHLLLSDWELFGELHGHK